MLRTLLSAVFAGSLMAPAASADPFSFVALGDAPYGEPAEVYPLYEALIDRVNATGPDLVIHVGDTKSGSTPCSDAMLEEQRAFLNRFAAPVLYTPGDNEWTDCHRPKAGGFDPLERLAHLRRTYFGDGSRSLGAAPVPVESQAAAGYPENARLLHKGVMFVTAHVVGSNNNFEIRDRAAVAEFFDRNAATVAWVKESFAAAAAADAAAVVVAIQADMFEADFGMPWAPETWLRHSGFLDFGEALKAEAAAFGKPVLLVYGDSHVFRQGRPFPSAAPNLMSLEVPGDKDMHAVTVHVNPDAPGIFSVSLLRNPAIN